MDGNSKLNMLNQIYTYVFNNVESFEEENIGADIAYLMGAILSGTKCAWAANRPLVLVLEEGKAREGVAYALKHIHISEAA
jgi:hypothetical protein